MALQRDTGQTPPSSVQSEAAPPERLSDILPSILPLAQQFLDNQRQEIALKERAQERDARLEEQELTVASQQWRWQVVFAGLLCLAFLGISSGLIFYLREVNAGLLVLSHLAALAAGAIGGAGWARRNVSADAGEDEAI